MHYSRRSLVAALVLLVAAIIGALWAGTPTRADERVVPDVVYGHKDGMALTFDVIKPVKPNGAAIVRIQSAAWVSEWADPKDWLKADKPFLDKGYTIFVVRHGSAPKYTIPEITQDVRRSVRFIRMTAELYGVDPNRLGVLGGSAGGHLALLLGTTGDDGDPKAADPVLRQSSRVAAVVALYPPTDIRDWVTNPPDAVKFLPSVKPALSFDPALAKDYSPALLVTDQTAPTLLLHGDKDPLVPLSHSQTMLTALEAHHIPSKLVVYSGAGHGFKGLQLLRAFLEVEHWFDSQLAKRNH